MTSGSETRPRSHHLTVRLSAEERAAVDAAAEAQGVTSGSYAREQMLGGPTARTVKRPPAERRELVRLLGQLGKIGSNLNQLTKAANSGTVLYADEVSHTLQELKTLRDELLKALGRSP